MNESSFEGVGGLKIFTRSWHPGAEQPRAVVVIVPGFNSHSGYYQWVADETISNRGQTVPQAQRASFYQDATEPHILLRT